MVGVLPREERTATGVLLMLCAVALFVGVDTSAKWLILVGISPIQVVFSRYAGQFIFALLFFLPREGRAVFRAERPGLQLLRSLAAAGHGSQILIADGHYPVATGASPTAERVYLNLSRGVVDGPTVLAAILSAVEIESATLMATAPPAPPEPEIWSTYADVFAAAGRSDVTMAHLERFAFYEAARGDDVAVVVATAETAIYANLLLTIGVAQ